MDGDELLHAGSMAPDFFLLDQDGEEQALADYRGRWVFLFFYPYDSSPGSAEEACAIRDYFAGFERFGVAVVGVSGDSVEDHKQFAVKCALPFPMLSDRQKQVADRYDALRSPYFLENGAREIIRKAFLINVMGEIEKIYENLKPKALAEKALGDLAEMMGQQED
jgi:peroxiredoxin Q/BCP